MSNIVWITSLEVYTAFTHTELKLHRNTYKGQDHARIYLRLIQTCTFTITHKHVCVFVTKRGLCVHAKLNMCACSMQSNCLMTGTVPEVCFKTMLFVNAEMYHTA